MPRKLYWVLTNYCNLGCAYCYYNTGLSPRHFSKFPYADYKKIIPQFKAHFDEIIFTGGEPLLNKDLFKIARLCHQAGLEISLLTNGVLLSEPIIAKIITTGFKAVSVSLDSLRPEVNDFQRGQGALVIRNLQNLLKLRPKGMEIEIMQTVTRQNLADILTISQFCKTNQIAHWVDPVEINPAVLRVQKLALEKTTQKERQNLEQALLKWAGKDPVLLKYTAAVLSLIQRQKPTNLFCPMGTNHFVLDVDHNLYPCFSRHDLSLGNVFQAPLSQILANKKYLQEAQPQLQQAKCVTLGCVCMTIAGSY